MKLKWILVMLLCGSFNSILAQNSPEKEPPYKRFPGLPPLSLLQTDSSLLTKESLKKNHPTIIMYFSPTCEHCIAQMNEMMKRIEDLRPYQVVMATYQPFEEMVDFYKKYWLSRYTNFKIGRDAEFRLPPFYVIKNLPFFALYDKKGNLITTFEGNTSLNKILGAFSKKKKQQTL